jgi:hypothetical protein
MKIDIAFEDGHEPTIPVGAVIRLDPVVGESGYIAAFKMVDARSDRTIATIPASQVTIDGKKGARIRVADEVG